MKNRLTQFIGTYFGANLDFRVRLFNVLAMAGILVSLLSVVSSLLAGDPIGNVALYLFFCLLAAGLLWYSTKTGRYQLCYKITIFIIFLIGFPFFFLTGSGSYGSMPYFFIFAVVFTVFMLSGKEALLLAALELALYTGLCIYAYRYLPPDPHSMESAHVTFETIFGFLTVGTALGISLFLHFRLYNDQQKQLAEQNILLGQINRMKTELLGNISHELKTPLTVISVHTQRAQALLELGREGDLEKIRESHALAQEEVMRLSRLVDSTLRLASLQEVGEQRAVLDLCSILRTTAETYQSLLEKKGNALTLSLPENPLTVFGNSDQLVQLISNLLGNAGAHTQRGEICVRAEQSDKTAEVTITDTGTGIAPELLSRVFERGVTGGEGSGLGLSIARQIARDHGGEIAIDSAPDMGTTVTVTLPLHREEDAHAQSQTIAH